MANTFFYTIERPWIPVDVLGGKPFASCIPDGEYDLVPFERANGDHVMAMVNPDLGVGLHAGNRYACLIHAGNYVDDVSGCIAPGIGRSIYNNRIMVTRSRDAMKLLAELVPFDETHTIIIRNTMGAV